MQRFSMIATDVIHGVLDLSAMPGERVNATPVQASVLLRKKLARFATKADEPPPAPPDPEPEPEPIAAVTILNHNLDDGVTVTLTRKPARRRRSRTYKTRDMAAE